MVAFIAFAWLTLILIRKPMAGYGVKLTSERPAGEADERLVMADQRLTGASDRSSCRRALIRTADNFRCKPAPGYVCALRWPLQRWEMSASLQWLKLGLWH